MSEYDGKQFVGIDLHRRHSVIVRQTGSGERLSAVRIGNDPDSLALQLWRLPRICRSRRKRKSGNRG